MPHSQQFQCLSRSHHLTSFTATDVLILDTLMTYLVFKLHVCIALRPAPEVCDEADVLNLTNLSTVTLTEITSRHNYV